MGVKEILVFLILFGANLLQAITGFAGTLISMPPTMKLIGVDEAKALLNAIAQISSLMIVITGFRHINWKEFFKMFVLMAAGMVVGMKIFEVFPMQQLLTFYGIMIIVIALDKLFVKNSSDFRLYLCCLSSLPRVLFTECLYPAGHCLSFMRQGC